jgi:hypothetical protein
MEDNMFEKARSASELNHEETARFVMDIFHRVMIHHALWFTEARHQFGMEKALELLQTASEKSFGIQLKHLGSLLGFELKDGVPTSLLEMSEENLNALKDRAAKNWLVNDGVWFQSIEFSQGMNDAKRCNDSCWAHFSPVEAHSIKKLLGLSEHPGLEGLKRALGFRVYESINVQSISEETENSFVFQMNQCRVQGARKRKGLDDYPCKSAGLVEYTYFARAIDKRIKTECIGCPPDPHPEEWFCAWKFSIDD